MKKINWKVRFRNSHFIIALIAMILLLAEQVARLFGYNLDQTVTEEILVITRTVLAILSLIGVIEDPVTEGFSDSELAMTYEQPKKRGEKYEQE